MRMKLTGAAVFAAGAAIRRPPAPEDIRSCRALREAPLQKYAVSCPRAVEGAGPYRRRDIFLPVSS